MHGADGAVGKDSGIEAGGGLGILVVPDADRIFAITIACVPSL